MQNKANQGRKVVSPAPFKEDNFFDHLQYFTLNTLWLSPFTNLSLYNIGSFVKIPS